MEGYFLDEKAIFKVLEALYNGQPSVARNRLVEEVEKSRKKQSMTTKTFVVFELPGSFYSNETVREVTSRQTPSDIPERSFAYWFYDQEVVEVNGEVLTGNRKNVSGKTYFGTVMTLEEVKMKVPNSDILVSNMKCNGWDRVVKTRLGNFQPLRAEDTVIS